MTVLEFDSFDEAASFMRQKEQEANAGLADEQKGISYGDCWVRVFGGGLEYGRVFKQDVAERNQTAETVRALRDAYRRGYRFSSAHSVLCPEGEIGDTHLAVMWPITKEEFEHAQNAGWEFTGEEWERKMLTRIIKQSRKRPAPETASPQEG